MRHAPYFNEILWVDLNALSAHTNIYGNQKVNKPMLYRYSVMENSADIEGTRTLNRLVVYAKVAVANR